MALIRKPSQLKVQTFIKALFYGQPGIGKSTLGLSAPAPLLLDFDGGVHRINVLHLKDTVQIEKWQDVLDLLDNEDLAPYKTLVIDTAGKMVDYMSQYIMERDPRMKMSDGSLSLKGYGARKVMFQNFFKRVSMLGKHVVMVAHEREEKDGDTRYVRPEIGGSSGNDLMKELDLVGYMEAKGNKRTISFDATEKYYGKNTCNLPALIEIPVLKDAKIANEFLVGIFDQYQNMISQKLEMMQVYNHIMDEVDIMLAPVESISNMNEVLETCKTITHIWDSKFQVATKISLKAKELNFNFNRQTGLYEAPAPATDGTKKKKQKAQAEPTAGDEAMVNSEAVDGTRPPF